MKSAAKRQPLKKRKWKELKPVAQADPARINDTQTVIPDFVIDSLARCLLPQAYFASPEGQAAFAVWKEKQKRENT